MTNLKRAPLRLFKKKSIAAANRKKCFNTAVKSLRNLRRERTD